MARYQASEREARYVDGRKWGLPPVVTEGDSWFSYELYLNIVDRIDDTKRFALKRLESSGDTISNMVGYTADARGVRALKKIVQTERPIFLFFSGGGNDIVGPELRGAILPFHPLRKAENYLDTDLWRGLMANLRQGYQVLADEIGPLCPVFVHGYDYFYPSNKEVKIFPGVPGPGPWVWPQMMATDINITDPALQRDIGRAMIKDLNDNILAPLEKANAGFFVHVDLRDTLSSEKEWQNEIHATRDGFAKLAKRFLAIVDSKLPDMRKARAERLGGMIA
jgi:hypothetical protein